MPYKDEYEQKQAQHKSYLKNKDKVLERTRTRRARNYKFVLKYLLAHPCVDCGESDPRVLDFDHIGEKTKSISQLMQFSNLERIQNEINKCEVRCANCHRRRTHKNYFTFKESILMTL